MAFSFWFSWYVIRRSLASDPSDVASQALYHYHLDDEATTGRIVGFAARMCLEMGLHRHEAVLRTFPNLDDQVVALKTFCAVYMLERRTSLGLGIPYIIQDSHLDPALFTSVSAALPCGLHLVLCLELTIFVALY